MKLNELKYFIEVIDSRNISVAAKKLYISQPNLSRSIRNLEKKMGKKLLTRTVHGVEPTSAGNQLYFYAQSIQKQLLMLERLKNIDNTKVVSRLHISIGSLFLKDDLLLKFYNKTNSIDTEISLFETTVEEAVQNVINTKSEFAIVILNDSQLPVLEKMAESYELNLKVLDKGPMYFHIHKDHPLFNKNEIHPSELVQYPYVHLPYDLFSSLNYSLTSGGTIENSFQKTITINNYHSMLNVLRNTGAYMYGNKWQIHELSCSSICSAKIADSIVQQNFILVKRNRENFSKSAKIFLDILKESYDIL